MDNVVEYRVFLKDEKCLERDSNTELYKYLAFLSPLVADYIWQNDSFALEIKTSSGDVPAHLYGKTDFGDNVDDEWFIVYLLCKLTKAFPGVCVSIADNDGDFLLIEAAHFLPKWLNPDSSKNRVFICNERVHIIPIPSSPGEVTIYPTGTPTVHQALKLVFGPHNTVAEEKIQRAIRTRIQGFLPEQIQKCFHHAHCFVPAEVKYILDAKLSLISPVVQAFYDRDPIDMKACRTVDRFPLKTRVMTRIRFTRCLYAQLSQQTFKPDRRSEWTLPLISDPLYKAHELGLKLACGFQILCGRSGVNQAGLQVEEANAFGPKWERFLTCLKEQDYFRGELEGSKLYQDLLKKAKRQFSETFAVDNSAKSAPGDIIVGMLKDVQIDVNKMKEEDLVPEDDDSWLNMSPEELDEILGKYSDPNMKYDGTGDSAGEIRGKSSGTSLDLESVTRSMKSFVDKVSSYEGAEFPGDREDEDIQFDASSFMDTIGNLLEHRTQRGEESESDSDDEEPSESSDEEIQCEQGIPENRSQDAASEEDSEMTSYMNQMDWELAQTSVGQSFEKKSSLPGDNSGQTSSHETAERATNGTDDSSDETPVDVDFNLVKNILESFSTQQGLAGPASNILNSMGVWLPSNTDST